MKKWRENKTNAETESPTKNEFKDINTKVNDIQKELNEDTEKTIKKVFNSEDESIRTAFNLNRSVEMSDLLLLANYVSVKRTVK
jgi:hypothetical protein